MHGAQLAVAVAHDIVFPEAIDLYPATDSDDYPAAATMQCAAGYWGLLFVDKVLVSFSVPSDDEQAAAAGEPAAAEVKMDSTSGGGTGHNLGVEQKAAAHDHDDGCGMDKVLSSSNMLQGRVSRYFLSHL